MSMCQAPRRIGHRRLTVVAPSARCYHRRRHRSRHTSSAVTSSPSSRLTVVAPSARCYHRRRHRSRHTSSAVTSSPSSRLTVVAPYWPSVGRRAATTVDATAHAIPSHVAIRHTFSPSLSPPPFIPPFPPSAPYRTDAIAGHGGSARCYNRLSTQ